LKNKNKRIFKMNAKIYLLQKREDLLGKLGNPIFIPIDNIECDDWMWADKSNVVTFVDEEETELATLYVGKNDTIIIKRT